MMEIDGRHTIKNKNKIFKKTRKSKKNGCERETVSNQSVCIFLIYCIFLYDT